MTPGSSSPAPGVPDPYGTDAIRAATLAAWTSSPTRFREDANTEEDYARGYYRDRVVVELAQNAADAAGQASGAGPATGRLLLRLESADEATYLVAANTGAPLTDAGVRALASMRASAKAGAAPDLDGGRGGTAQASSVGRFGVGFAALRGVSDEIVVASAGGAVAFSASRTRAVLAGLRDRGPGAGDAAGWLADALDRRDADLPVLRLPFPVPVEALPGPIRGTSGYDTVVLLRLRGPQEAALVERLLDEVDDVLLLALPALAEVRVEVGVRERRLAAVAERWVTASAHGQHDPADLADRPHEERSRADWSVTWAVPRATSPHRLVPVTTDPVTRTVHAPTPTDEPCTLPGVLVATFPLDPSRRHVAWAPATQRLVAEAAEVYADLVADLAAGGHDPLAYVPLGLPAGRLDAALHEAVLATLPRRALLAPAHPVAGPALADLLTAREARAIAGAVGHDRRALAALAPWCPGLVPTPHGAEAVARLRRLGVEIRDLADIVDDLPAAPPSPETCARLHAIYDALAPHAGEPGVADALAGLPVALADGRTVRGPRGVVVLDAQPGGPDAGAPADTPDGAETPAVPRAFAPWGLRVADPRAAHPLLTRLGAAPTTPAALLSHPAVRAGILAAAGAGEQDDLDTEAFAVVDATLALVRAALDAGAEAEEFAADHPWLGALPLADADAEPTAARELTLPGTWADQVLDGLAPLDPTLLESQPPAVFRALGVREGLVVERLHDVVAEPPLVAPGPEGVAPEASLDGWAAYLDHLAHVLGAGAFVGDLAAVADLDVVAEDSWADVLTHLARDPRARAALLEAVHVAEGTAPSYTAWWLRERLGAPFAAPGAHVPFLPPAPPVLAGLDGAVLAALGAVSSLAALDADEWVRYLDALPPAGSAVALDVALEIWRGLAAAASLPGAGRVAAAPARVPVLRLRGDAPEAVVAPARSAAVAPEAMWAQVRPVLPAPAALAAAVADYLDLDLLDHEPAVGGAGRDVPTPAEVRLVLPGAPATWWEHDDLRVDGVAVDWWVTGRGEDAAPHAATLAGLARALAQAAGRWPAYPAIELVLSDPDRAHELAAESAWSAGLP